MAILDKVLGVGEAIKQGVKRTFGDSPDDLDAELDAELDGLDDLPDDPAPPALSIDEAYAVLGLRGDATLADVRAAYRSLARQHHPTAVVEGPGQEQARLAIDRCTDALELLEEALLPLSGTAPSAAAAAPAAPRTGLPQKDAEGRRRRRPNRPR